MTPTDAQRLEQRIERHFNRGIRHFNLLSPADHLLIGLSGGKDSLALVQLLGRRWRRSNFNFRLTALHVQMQNVDYLSDTQYLKNFCQEQGVELIIRQGAFEPDRDAHRSPCFLCSWNRRKLLFQTAQEIGANKIALGHHQDDILHTALLNLTFNGQFSTMPVRLTMCKFPLTIVRPLCCVQEADLRLWNQMQAYRPLQKNCPYERDSHRHDMRLLFAKLEQLNHEARYNLWHALEQAGKLVE